MRRIGARHKRPQRFGRNEHAAKHPDGGQSSARDQALHRSHGDTAELFRGLSEAICKSFIVHWVHPIASKSSICPVFVQYLSSVCPVVAIHQSADAKASAMSTLFRASLTPENLTTPYAPTNRCLSPRRD